ncbi:unnamed protein product [Auanema sp. JU1783]|nr:unnamed protein product [Auanema sp. JU1783]
MRLYHLLRIAFILIACSSLYLLLRQRHLCHSKEYENMLEIVLTEEEENSTEPIYDSDYSNDITTLPQFLNADLHVRRKRQKENDEQVLDLPIDEGSNPGGSQAKTTKDARNSIELLSSERNTNLTEATQNSTESIPTRLIFNKIYRHVCLQMTTKDIFGYGDTSTHILTRPLTVPAVFLIIEIIFATINIVQVHSTFKDLTKAQTCMNNIVHIIFWSISAVSLILHRFSWDDSWSRTNFLPFYPSDWYFVEIICYIVVALLVLEIYVNEWTFYTIYIEKSSGVYRVMERPEFQCSVYHDGVQQIAN